MFLYYDLLIYVRNNLEIMNEITICMYNHAAASHGVNKCFSAKGTSITC